jgi:hypothetical protein
VVRGPQFGKRCPRPPKPLRYRPVAYVAVLCTQSSQNICVWPVIVSFVAYLATVSLPRDWSTGGHNAVRPRHWIGSPKMPVKYVILKLLEVHTGLTVNDAWKDVLKKEAHN